MIGIHGGLAECVEIKCGELVHGVIVNERQIGENITTVVIHGELERRWSVGWVEVCGWEGVSEVFDGHGGAWCEMGPELVE